MNPIIRRGGVRIAHLFLASRILFLPFCATTQTKSEAEQLGGNDCVNDTQGLTYGVQMEAWW